MKRQGLPLVLLLAGLSRAGGVGVVGVLSLGCQQSAEKKALLARVVTDTMPGDVIPMDTDFDGKVRLVGYSTSPKLGTHAVGSGVTLTLVWRCDAKVDSGFKLFTHVLGPEGEQVMNLDDKGPLRKADGLEPSEWQPGHFYRDEMSFTIPLTAPPSITIAAGIAKDATRLPIKAGRRDGENRARVVTLVTNGREAGARMIKELDALHLVAGESIVIDGKLDEPAWARAKTTGPFVDVGTGRSSAGYPTVGVARLLWDDKFLYAGFDVADKKVHGGWDVDGGAAKEPHLWEKDTVELMIDPDGDGDNKDYYEIQVNPQNLVFDTQYDGYNSPNGNGKGPFGHEEWSAKLTSAVLVHGTLDDDSDLDRGYTVEVQIPWSSFTKAEHSPPRPGDVWRMNFYAMKNNGGTAWSPILGMGNFHRASRFGRVKWVAAP
jgi:hypothetical protein